MGDILTAHYEQAKMGKVKVSSKIILFSKTVQDYGNGSADICLVVQAVGQAGHSLSMR